MVPRRAKEEEEIEEVSGDDPMVLELEKRLQESQQDADLTLEQLLNPATVINAQRDIIRLRAEMLEIPQEEGYPNDCYREQREALEKKIDEKELKIVDELRQVMTDGLKFEFLWQGIGSIPILALMAADSVPFFPKLWFGWKLFGTWGIWLLTIPALRARKPGGQYGMGNQEKRGLDIAFLTLPLVLFGTPFFTKSISIFTPFFPTYLASLVWFGACMAWTFLTPKEDNRMRRRGVDVESPGPLQWVLSALDFGSGSERGVRQEDESWVGQTEEYQRQAEAYLAEKTRLKAEMEAKEERSGKAPEPVAVDGRAAPPKAKEG